MKQMIIGLLAVLVAGTVEAASFSYQGVLRDATGGAVAEKNKSIEFRLYASAESDMNQALWGRKIAVLLDDNGLFNVELSDANTSESLVENGASLDNVIAENATLYIGLTVSGSSGEIRPRQKLLSVPRASFAEDVQMAKNSFTVLGTAMFEGPVVHNGAVEVNSNITARTISVDDAITAVKVKVSDSLTVSGGALTLSNATLTVNGVDNAFIPSGVIVMWSGAANAIPEGWVLCDGKNGTPNLLDRFIVGAGGAYKVGETGGTNDVALTIGQMPKHRHEYVGDDELWYADDIASSESKENGKTYDADSNEKKGSPRRYMTTYAGGGEAHENRPPYYALCFIMKK